MELSKFMELVDNYGHSTDRSISFRVDSKIGECFYFSADSIKFADDSNITFENALLFDSLGFNCYSGEYTFTASMAREIACMRYKDEEIWRADQ